MNNPKHLVIITILLWSFGPLLTRLISIQSQLLSLDILFFFTFLFYLIMTIIHYKSKFFAQIKKLTGAFIIFGLCSYFFYYLGLVQSFHLFNSASEPAILNYTFPLFTVIFTEVWVGRKNKRAPVIRLIEYLGVLVGFFAVIILATKGDLMHLQFTNVPAFLWGLSAAIAYAIFSVYSGSVKSEDQDIFLLAAIFSSFILAMVISFSSLSSLSTVSLQILIANVLLAIIINGFGYLAWTRANRLAYEKNISISSVASLILIIPFFGLIIVALVLHETTLFQPYFLVSLIGIIISSFLSQKAGVLFALGKKLH